MKILLNTKILEIYPNIPKKYFQAALFGAALAAARDVIVIFYSVERGSDGIIRNICFNFIARDEFEKTYQYIKE